MILTYMRPISRPVKTKATPLGGKGSMLPAENWVKPLPHLGGGVWAGGHLL